MQGVAGCETGRDWISYQSAVAALGHVTGELLAHHGVRAQGRQSAQGGAVHR